MIKEYKTAGFVKGGGMTKKIFQGSEAKIGEIPGGNQLMIPRQNQRATIFGAKCSQNDAVINRIDQRNIGMSESYFPNQKKYDQLSKPTRSFGNANLARYNTNIAQRGGYYPQINRTSTMMMIAQPTNGEFDFSNEYKGLGNLLIEEPEVVLQEYQESKMFFQKGWIQVKQKMTNRLKDVKQHGPEAFDLLVNDLTNKEKSFSMQEAKEYLDECLTAYVEAFVIKLSQTEDLNADDVAKRTREYFFEDLDMYFNQEYYPPDDKLSSIKYSEKARDFVRGKFLKQVTERFFDEKLTLLDFNLDDETGYVHMFAFILNDNDYGIPKEMTAEIFLQTLIQSFDEVCQRIQGVEDMKQRKILKKDYWDEKIYTDYGGLRELEENEQLYI